MENKKLTIGKIIFPLIDFSFEERREKYPHILKKIEQFKTLPGEKVREGCTSGQMISILLSLIEHVTKEEADREMEDITLSLPSTPTENKVKNPWIKTRKKKKDGESAIRKEIKFKPGKKAVDQPKIKRF